MEKQQFAQSRLIREAKCNRYRLHKGDGDMWPVTWAGDGALYGAAGDNQASPMNIWRIDGHPDYPEWMPTPYLFLQNNMPIDLLQETLREGVHPKWGVKPASMISLGGVLYLAVEQMNFGDRPEFNRQHNLSVKLISSKDGGVTWKSETPWDFFPQSIGAPHFIQFGRDYEGAPDENVYAYFPSAEDGNSYWDNGDFLLLGRALKGRVTDRDSWRFYTGLAGDAPRWSADYKDAVPVFSYPLMTGENHVSYHAGLKRYLMGNYSFTDTKGRPKPYHQDGPLWDSDTQKSELTLFEAPAPWGPWSLFYKDADWGRHGGYNPSFPTKWMSKDGREAWMVYSGSEEDYNFTLQKVTFTLY